MRREREEDESEMERDEEDVSPPLLTVSEAAKQLGVGKTIIYQLIDTGEIRAVKGRGGAVLVEKKSLDEFRASGRLP